MTELIQNLLPRFLVVSFFSNLITRIKQNPIVISKEPKECKRNQIPINGVPAVELNVMG